MNLLQDLLGRLKEEPTNLEEDKRESLHELINKYIDVKEIHNFEGERGVRWFTELVSDLDDNYRDLDSFLADNSGCMEVMIEWIMEQRSPEWIENIKRVVER